MSMLLAERQFRTEVFPQELEIIGRRRANAGLPVPPVEGTGPSTQLDLTGLALSGGGIRSAAFSLGALQALSAGGLLPHVDYLSTVSGGGLIGASVSALLNSKDTSSQPDRFPLGFEAGTVERPAVRHLRSHTRWLAPDEGLDDIRLPAVLLRGICDNFAIVLPLLMIAVLLTEQLFNLAYRIGLDTIQYAPALGVAVFIGLALAQPVLYRLLPNRYMNSWAARNDYERVLTISLVVIGALLVIGPLLLLVQQAIDMDFDEVRAWTAAHRATVSASAVGALAVISCAAVFAFTAADRLIGKISLVVVGLLGHAIVLGLYLLLTLIQVDSPVLSYPAGAAGSPLADLQSGRVTPALAAQLRAMSLSAAEGAIIETRGSGTYTRWKIDATSPSGDDLIVTRWKNTLRVINMLTWDGDTDWWFFAVGIIGLFYAAFFANPNITSAHDFFRDRMSRAFLMEDCGSERVMSCDNLLLSRLNADGSTAPYHLLNTTLNLQGSRDADLAGRKADFFVLSHAFCGSPTTGYCKTTDLEQRDRHLNLGTAMAISGAGMSPNAGTQTVKSLVYLMTLFNLRLDYWLPNPRFVATTSALRKLRLGAAVGPVYMLKEALGLLDGGGTFVNLSDGGQLENLGLYELLRRRCRSIVAVDASEDPSMTCPCLMDAIRYARIDLGITVTIDVDLLAKQSNGLSSQHMAVGSIDYGGGEIGQLTYVKASMTGDESAEVRQYREMNRAFPQDPSSNQFFNESQFEAYRALGEHIGRELMANWQALDLELQGVIERDIYNPELA
jgi:hypothetical protein